MEAHHVDIIILETWRVPCPVFAAVVLFAIAFIFVDRDLADSHQRDQVLQIHAARL